MATRSLLPDDDNFDPLSAPTLVMRHTVPSELPPLESILIPPEPEPASAGARRLLGPALLLAALLGGGAWLLLRPGSEAPAPAPAPAASAVASPPSTPVAPAVVVPPAPAASIAAVPPAASQAASVPERRKRIPEPVERKQAMDAAPAPSPTPEPEVMPAPPPTAPASAVEPARPKSVTELCGGGSLITRGFCEHRECDKPEHAGDAVCLRLKEAEEARRFRQ